MLDVELALIICRTMAVGINLPEQQRLSPAYEMPDTPVAWPDYGEVVGPAPLVERVRRVQVTL